MQMTEGISASHPYAIKIMDGGMSPMNCDKNPRFKVHCDSFIKLFYMKNAILSIHMNKRKEDRHLFLFIVRVVHQY
ncbi:hypothetical protein AOC36_08980 [Erysipelothrix larvae]|uniref:Uncharacterized protein n=1 Tax=Erysipelothrix larvae TaxID=1514105 RepID=A0A0X8H143_9FIRM|nr:hypothetical protein AOC36_08980 [Erysipelothrix larvae]